MPTQLRGTDVMIICLQNHRFVHGENFQNRRCRRCRRKRRRWLGGPSPPGIITPAKMMITLLTHPLKCEPITRLGGRTPVEPLIS